MRLVVTGGRNFTDVSRINYVLDGIHAHLSVSVLINGLADGADHLCREWGIRTPGVEVLDFPAKWKDLTVPNVRVKQGKYGPYNVLAGHNRNQEMIDDGKPDYFVSFPGGSGTADMLNRLMLAGIHGWNYSI